MKTQEFANHFNIKKTTVRYYRDKKLIIPNVIQNYCDYNELCINDMKDVLDMREMGFSIDEIQAIKNYERLMVAFSSEEKKIIRQLFNDKIKENDKEIEKLKSKNAMIEKYLNNLSKDITYEDKGISLELLQEICCPKCMGKLVLEEARIINQELFDGIFTCECGKTMEVENGILLCHNDLQKHEEVRCNIDFLLDNPYERITCNHIGMNLNIGYQLSKYLNEIDHSKGIIFYYADSDLLMMRLHEKLNENGKYIFVSYDYKSLLELRERVQRLRCKGKYLFAYLEDYIPCKKGFTIIDNSSSIVDFFMSKPGGHSIDILNNYMIQESLLFKIQLTMKIDAKTFKLQNELMKYIGKEYNNYYIKSKEWIVEEKIEIGDMKDLGSINSLYSDDDTMDVEILKITK